MLSILFSQLSGHMHAVIELSAGDFVRGALLCGLSGNFGFCASSVEALALMLCAKVPKEIIESAATATKVLMDFMVVFLKRFVSVGALLPRCDK
ncbi:Uncharacterised protein [Klebsiella michiganensis]|uniref:Uncharacterized protein n=1 Tax=Klebsiella michiganensis TaxID=1134687 RepID=A0A7H4LS95_9ENTR|nr:Uncharacterised protein [Klebsiella michiganensis]